MRRIRNAEIDRSTRSRSTNRDLSSMVEQPAFNRLTKVRFPSGPTRYGELIGQGPSFFAKERVSSRAWRSNRQLSATHGHAHSACLSGLNPVMRLTLRVGSTPTVSATQLDGTADGRQLASKARVRLALQSFDSFTIRQFWRVNQPGRRD